MSTTAMSWLTVMLRFALMIVLFGVLLFGFAGRFDIASFWTYLLLFAATRPVMHLAAGPELMRERINPPPGGKDQLIRILAIPTMLAHLAIAGLDVGRFHWSEHVPFPLQAGSFIALAVCLGIWALAMLCVRRIVIADRTLQHELEGYKDYAQRLRYRILPGVW